MPWSGSTRASARAAKHKQRVDQVREKFLSLKRDMEIRRYMLTIVRDHGLYCQTCSPLRKVGECGPTCPLLRPGGTGSGIAYDATETWRRESLEILRRYKAVTDDLQRHSYNVSAFELGNWEREGEDMQWRDVDQLAHEQSLKAEARLSIYVDFAEVDWNAGATREQEELRSPSS